MHRRFEPLLRILLSLTVVTSIGRAGADVIPPAELTDDHIDIAMRAMIGELHDRAHPEHFWDPAEWSDALGPASQRGGYTALVTLALLEAGESYQSERLRPVIEHLRKVELNGTYAVAMRAHVWAQLPPAFDDALRADVEWLTSAFSSRSLGWDYTKKPYTTYADNSLRQYATLALWEASKRGMEIPSTFWSAIEKVFIDKQQETGGWNYRDNGDAAYGSMTTAGLAILFITQDELHSRTDRALRSRDTPAHRLAIARGMDWMHRHFEPGINPGRATFYYFYYLYGVERIGLASGYATFGGHDWYRTGTSDILRELGTWSNDRSVFTINENRRAADGTDLGRVDTRHLAFSLLFLSRGRSPFAVMKAQFTPGRWNNRPRDVATFTRHLESVYESAMPWVIVSLDDDWRRWRRAPLLYIASDQTMPVVEDHLDAILAYIDEARDASTAMPTRPTIPMLDRLGAYLESGGMVLAVNEGGRRVFAQSIEYIGSFLFPSYAWRTLPRDHWVYSLHTKTRGTFELRALSNGVRELIILSPKGDLAGQLQDRDTRRSTHLDIATNIWTYASERDRSRAHLGPPVRDNDAAALPDDAPIFTIARGRYEGHWNVEPGAARAVRRQARDAGIDVRIVDVPIATVRDHRPDLLWITGVASVTLTDTQRQAIIGYIRAGGTTLVETVGGTGDFAESIERQLMADGRFDVRLLRDHPVITGRDLDDGRDRTRVGYRAFSAGHLGARDATPRLRAAMIDDRCALLFSREDLSHALLDHPAWFISGYTTSTARDLMWNLIQSIRGFRPAPAPASHQRP